MQYRNRFYRPVHSGFTLVEVLVVVVIIGILLSMVLVGGSAVIASAKKSHTKSLFGILDQAVTEYVQDAKQNLVPGASEAFGDYPPDNIYVFSGKGGGANIGNMGSIRMGPTKSQIVPGPSASNCLTDRRDTNGHLLNANSRGYGDIRAMVLAMRLRSPRASAVLDRVDEQFVKVAEPDEYYNPGDGSMIPLDYFVDAWGTPIEYYSTKATSSNGGATKRDLASERFLNLNNGKPLFVSYGPNGPEQFASDYLTAPAFDSSMVGDFSDTSIPGIIDNELNDDNVYSTDFIAERLRAGSSRP